MLVRTATLCCWGLSWVVLGVGWGGKHVTGDGLAQ